MQTQKKMVPVTGMTDEEVLAEALAWVNTIRGEYGAEPLSEMPAAIKKSSTDCAIAEGLLPALHDGSGTFATGGRYLEAEAFPEDVLQATKDAGGESSARLRVLRDGKINTLYPPPVVAEFMSRFDAGRYPDLVKP